MSATSSISAQRCSNLKLALVTLLLAAWATNHQASGQYPPNQYQPAQYNPNLNQNDFPTFKALLAVPLEKATVISRELQEAISWWEGIHRNIQGRPNWNNIYAPNGDDLNPGSLQFSQIHVGNDTLRMFSVLCDALEKDNPSIIVSLVDSRKTDYMRMIAESAAVPLLTLSSDYAKEPLNIVKQGRQGLIEARSMELSLDPPVSALADAAFELLRSQNWFDAILIIDDSTASDVLSYRLRGLCRRKQRFMHPTAHSGKGDIYEQRRRNWISKTKGSEYRRIDSAWNRLKVIQLTKNLLQKEFYMKVSEAQTSHRRVVMVHCDQQTTKKVIDTAKNLNLFEGQKIWLLLDGVIGSEIVNPELYKQLNLPDGMLVLHQRPPPLTNTTTLFDIIKLFGEAAESIFMNTRTWLGEAEFRNGSVPRVSCYQSPTSAREKYSNVVYRELNKLLLPMQSVRYEHHKCKSQQPAGQHTINMIHKNYLWPFPVFDILNLVPSLTALYGKEWKVVGNVTRYNATMDAIRFISRPSSDRSMSPSRHHFRVATALAAPFVFESSKFENESCLIGTPCLKVRSNIPEELVVIFTDYNSRKRYLEQKSYIIMCCAGISVDLLDAAARDLNFGYDLYLVADGHFGTNRNGRWDGIAGDVISGAAHLTFGAFSVTGERSEEIEYSVPFYYSGISCLAYSHKFDHWSAGLTTFFDPFTPLLWAAIFLTLLVTATAVAIYEWISPVGLHPRIFSNKKTFGIASSLWTFTSLLFRSFICLKTPQSTTNKLIAHIWGFFCVIFWATYVAQIAAHYTSYLPTYEIKDFTDGMLMPMRTGVVRSSSAEGYLRTENVMLWHHIQNHKVHSVEEGMNQLRKGKLDILIGDTAVFEYYKANEPGCHFRLLGQPIFDDSYAVGMQRDFPLKDALSDLILEYVNYGFMDQLKRKWFAPAPCASDIRKPTPLTFFSVSGVFLFLILGAILALVVLCWERCMFGSAVSHRKDNESYWKTKKSMFFSQKMHKFVTAGEPSSSNYSLKDTESMDSGVLSVKTLRTDTKEIERRSSF